jgi:hypothetical protein
VRAQGRSEEEKQTEVADQILVVVDEAGEAVLELVSILIATPSTWQQKKMRKMSVSFVSPRTWPGRKQFFNQIEQGRVPYVGVSVQRKCF